MKSLIKVCSKGALRVIHATKFVAIKKAPDLFIFGGIACVSAGMYFVHDGTKKSVTIDSEYEEEMEDAREIEDENERAKEKLRIKNEKAWKKFKAYAPSIIFATCGIGFILAGRGIMKRRYAAISSAYAILNETLENYRDRVRDAVGEEKERDLFYNTGEVEITEFDGKKENTRKEKVTSGSGHPLEFVFDEKNNHYKKYPGVNYRVLMNIANLANNKLNAKGYLTLSEVLEDLRMPVPDYALIFGWIRDPKNPHKVTFGMESNWELREGKETNCILKFNCDGNIMDKIIDAQKDNYGYLCNIA